MAGQGFYMDRRGFPNGSVRFEGGPSSQVVSYRVLGPKYASYSEWFLASKPWP